MKILLLGANGQVGWALRRSLAPLGKVIAPGREAGGDLAKPDLLRETVNRIKPVVIVNAAAYTAVDQAQTERKQAFLVNGQAPAVLAEAADATGAWLVHYSTDYVFDGQGSHPWREGDTPAPLNIYGQSKFAGEQAVVCCSRHLLFRTSWVYAARGKNFAATILRLAAERDKLCVVNDQFGAPTGADLIADVTAHTLRHVLMHHKDGGLYHLCAAGETTWHAYARFLVETARTMGFPVRVQPGAIEAVPGMAYPTPATRPSNSRLGCSKLESVFDLTMPDWQSGIIHLLEQWQAAKNYL